MIGGQRWQVAGGGLLLPPLLVCGRGHLRVSQPAPTHPHTMCPPAGPLLMCRAWMQRTMPPPTPTLFLFNAHHVPSCWPPFHVQGVDSAHDAATNSIARCQADLADYLSQVRADSEH